MTAFRLAAAATRWLRAEEPGASQGEAPAWDAWVLRRMCLGEVADVGGVLVDRAVLRQRFACVSERCAPRPGRGHQRSCCADVLVPLTRAEDRRLGRHASDLLGFMKAREPRLASCHARDFYRAEEAPVLARPAGRCVFSQLDARGRIRCRLHAYAKQAQVDRATVQPLGCRLFPLIVVDLGRGRVLLSVVAAHTHRLVASHPAHRYPCLCDPSLPPLHEALAADLDWLFGKGFAKALARAGQLSPSRHAAASDGKPPRR
jgi:hypothetical protein